MTSLNIYLFVRMARSSWIETVYSDLESVRAAWNTFINQPTAIGILHVGFNRLDANEFENLAEKYSGKLLLTAAARHIFQNLVAASSAPVGVVKAIPVYLALSGWGYTCTDETWGSNEGSSELYTENDRWISALSVKNPVLAATLNSLGITSEKTYREKEILLFSSDRIAAALFRMRALAGDKASRDPFVVLRYAPPWLLNAAVSSLDLGVRVSNVFRKLGVERVGDLTRYSQTKLLGVDNFGFKSLIETAGSLLKRLSKGPPDEFFTETASVPQNGDANPRNAGARSDMRLDRSSSLLLLLQKALDEIGGNKALVLKRRMGFDADPETLQEIANDFGITRERIRQIERKFLPILADRTSIDLLLPKRIEELLKGRIAPLSVHELEILDPWFKAISNRPRILEYLLDSLCGGNYHLVKSGSQLYVTAISQDEWDAAIQKAIQILETGIGKDWTEDQAKEKVAAVLADFGCELFSELWRALALRIHFATTPEGKKILISAGRGVEHAVEAVLAESDAPLHYSEIKNRVSERLGRAVDIRRAHNAAAEVGHLFGRGIFGSLKHLPLNKVEIGALVSRSEDLVKSGPASRQWHCKEILDGTAARGLEFGGRLTPYILNIVLQTGGASLFYLGRFIWTTNTVAPTPTTGRMDVRQAVISILEKSGRPMTTPEIREELLKSRGLGQHFQIHPHGNLVRFSWGVWGLADRDLSTKSSAGCLFE